MPVRAEELGGGGIYIVLRDTQMHQQCDGTLLKRRVFHSFYVFTKVTWRLVGERLLFNTNICLQSMHKAAVLRCNLSFWCCDAMLSIMTAKRIASQGNVCLSLFLHVNCVLKSVKNTRGATLWQRNSGAFVEFWPRPPLCILPMQLVWLVDYRQSLVLAVALRTTFFFFNSESFQISVALKSHYVCTTLREFSCSLGKKPMNVYICLAIFWFN